jgi:5-methylthioadenosine/S-adenosylhomocysteine deaminase
VSKLLLTNAEIVTLDAQKRHWRDGAILIEDDRITGVGRSSDFVAQDDVQRVDLRGRILLPGLINTHVHTSQQLGRGLADDVDLLIWLRERVWPYESNLTEDDSYISSLLCGIEQIRSGVTCFGEAGGQHVGGMARAIGEIGLRANLSRSTMDTGIGLPLRWVQTTDQALDAQVELFERWNGKANDRIRVWFNLRTIFNNSDDLIARTKELADKHGTGIQMHVAEIREEVEFARQNRGATTVTHLNRLGVLDSNLLAVHCVWMTDEEIQMFAENKVPVSHNPAAAMRVLGFAKVPEMLDAGICVTIGTDGAPCNNRMTLIDDMWLTALIHKGRLLSPTTMPAQTILTMATNNAARAMLREAQIGSLEVGKKADLVVINPNSANMLPLHDSVANLVSAMQAHNVESVMVDGRWLMRDREILTVNEAEVFEEAKRRAAAIATRAGIKLPDRFNVQA